MRYSATPTRPPRLASVGIRKRPRPTFVKTVADAAFIADMADYSLLRPVLLELKRRTSCLSRMNP